MAAIDFSHGGNIYEIEPRKRGSILDFSANINPLGIPTRIKKLLHRQLKDLVHYPDSMAHQLVTALAHYWKVKEENVLVGNGSTELIYLVLNAFGPATVTLPMPSFSEYERAARISRCRLRFVCLLEDEGFRFNPRNIKKSGMLFLCNPNNPTGNLLINSRVDIAGVSAERVVIDEAFMDFVPEEQALTFIPLAAGSKKFIVLRTLTKLFALPGLRVGYLVAHRDVIRTLKEYQIPWSVNTLAQTAAAQALREIEFIERSRQLIEKERGFLYVRLSRIRGLRPCPSVANFLLVKIEDRRFTSSCLKERLLKKGILIRDCANFRSLNKQFIRVAVRRHQENMRLIQALETSYKEKQ